MRKVKGVSNPLPAPGKPPQIDNSTGMTRGKGVGEEEEGKGGIKGDGRRLGVVDAQYDIQVVCDRIVYLKPGSFY